MAIINLNALGSISNACNNTNNSWVLNSSSVSNGSIPIKYKIGTNGTWINNTIGLGDFPFTIVTGTQDLFLDTDVYLTNLYPTIVGGNPPVFQTFGWDTTLNFSYINYCSNNSCGLNTSVPVYIYNNSISYEKNIVPALTAYQFIDYESGFPLGNSTPAANSNTAKIIPIIKNNKIYYSFYKKTFDYQSGSPKESTLVEWELPYQPLYTYSFTVASNALFGGFKIGNVIEDWNAPQYIDLNSGTNAANATTIKNRILSAVGNLLGTSSPVYLSFSAALNVAINDSSGNKIIYIGFLPYIYNSNIYLSVVEDVQLKVGVGGGGINFQLPTLRTIQYASNSITIPSQVSTSTYCSSSLSSTIQTFTTNFSGTVSSIQYAGPSSYFDPTLNGLVKISDTITGTRNLNSTNLSIYNLSVTGTLNSICAAINQVKFLPNYNIPSINSFSYKKNGGSLININTSAPTFINYTSVDIFEVTLNKTLPNSTSCINTRTYNTSNSSF